MKDTSKRILVDLEVRKMLTKVVLSIENENKYKRVLINMVYKLLPLREEGSDWIKYLESLILEIKGFDSIFENGEEISYIRLLSKLEGLKELKNKEDFMLFRKIIFECTNLINTREAGE